MTIAVQDRGEAPVSGRRRGSARRRGDGLGAMPGWLRWISRRGIALVSLLPALLAVLVVQGLSPAAQQAPAGLARFDLAGSWVASDPASLAGYDAWWTAPPLGWLQLGLLLRALGAGDAQSVLAAAHGVMLLLTLAQVALIWLLLRRGGASGLSAGLAAAIAGLAPEAVAAHTAVSTTAVAVVWALVAAVLIGFRARVLAVVAGLAAGIAIVTVPSAVLLVAATAVAFPRAGRSPRSGGAGGRLVGAAAGLAIALAGTGVASAALSAQQPTRDGLVLAGVGAAAGTARWGLGAAAAADWLGRDPLTLLALTAAVVLVAPLRAFRPVVVTAVLLAVAAFWPLGTDAVAPVLLLLPVTAVAVAVTVDRAVRALADPVLRTSVVGSAWLTGMAAVLTVAAVAWLLSLTGLRPASEQPVAKAASWIRASVPAGQTVLVDLGLWPDLSRDRHLRVGWYAAGGASTPTSVPWSAADYVLADSALASRSGGAVALTLRRSLPVAGFGSGASRLQVRAVQRATTPTATPTPSSTPDAAELRSAAARRSTGAQLAENPRITVSGSDRAALIAGDVDSRVAIVLAQFVTNHRIVVASFPETADDDGIRREVVISAVDGHRVPSDGTATGTLLRYLSSLREQYAAQSIDATDDGLLAVFSVDPTFVP